LLAEFEIECANDCNNTTNFEQERSINFEKFKVPTAGRVNLNPNIKSFNKNIAPFLLGKRGYLDTNTVNLCLDHFSRYTLHSNLRK
jgi:hypothetical protein